MRGAALGSRQKEFLAYFAASNGSAEAVNLIEKTLPCWHYRSYKTPSTFCGESRKTGWR
jgi:hypothetical protein